MSVPSFSVPAPACWLVFLVVSDAQLLLEGCVFHAFVEYSICVKGIKQFQVVSHSHAC